MQDKYTENSVISPATDAFAITPADGSDLESVPKALYIGGAGDVSVYMAGDSTSVTFAGVPAGTVLPIRVARVLSTGTTATNIVGLY